MIFPFIYTRTRNKDYRLLTSESLRNLPTEFVNRCRSVARSIIDAKDEQLEQDSWVILKSGPFTLWGKASLNRKVGTPDQDLYGRPVRGFFGIIIEGWTDVVPFGEKFFREIYSTYVTPLWDTLSDSEQVIHPLDIPFGSEVIQAGMPSEHLNTSASSCRLFPYSSDIRPFVSTALGYRGDISLATGIHKKSQVLDVTPDFSLMNAIMGPETGLTAMESINMDSYRASKAAAASQASASTSTREKLTDQTSSHSSNSTDKSASRGPRRCPGCGTPLTPSDGDLCPECDSIRRGRKIRKALVWSIFALIGALCVLLIVFATGLLDSSSSSSRSSSDYDSETTETGAVSRDSSSQREKYSPEDKNGEEKFNNGPESDPEVMIPNFTESELDELNRMFQPHDNDTIYVDPSQLNMDITKYQYPKNKGNVIPVNRNGSLYFIIITDNPTPPQNHNGGHPADHRNPDAQRQQGQGPNQSQSQSPSPSTPPQVTLPGQSKPSSGKPGSSR